MGENFARQEAAEYAALEKSIQEWWATSRFKHTKRPYTAKQVASLRGSVQDVPASAFTAKKLYNLLRSSFEKGEYAHTFGALDPVQVSILLCFPSEVWHHVEQRCTIVTVAASRAMTSIAV